eukprot:3232685-Pyramimonas_sp.AAC.1
MYDRTKGHAECYTTPCSVPIVLDRSTRHDTILRQFIAIKMLLLFVVGNVRVNLPLSPQARLMQRLEANARVEPFFHGLWARQPWPTRPYERLSDYT